MSQAEAIRRYFESSEYAVIGNLTEPNKFPYWILGWYVTNGLSVVPVDARAPSTWVAGKDLKNLESIKQLRNPADTSLNIVTGPWFTRRILEDAKELGIRRVWLQPGTYDDDILEYARANFEAGIGGKDGGKGNAGWCVLVDGDEGIKAAATTTQVEVKA